LHFINFQYLIFVNLLLREVMLDFINELDLII